jgi:hypothetical protein
MFLLAVGAVLAALPSRSTAFHRKSCSTDGDCGIRGRPIELELRDDEYPPESAQSEVRDLLDVAQAHAPAQCPRTTTVVPGEPPAAESALVRGPNAVLGLVGGVGAPTSYSKSVFGTAITPEGGIVNRYYWSAGGSLQLFESGR